MAAVSFTAAKFLAPVAARSGGERAPPLPAGASSSSSFVRTLRRGGAHHPRLRTALAVSSDLLAGNKAAQAAATHPVWNSFSSTLVSPITQERKRRSCVLTQCKNPILGALHSLTVLRDWISGQPRECEILMRDMVKFNKRLD
jgi:hypothetical protein